MPLPFYLPPDWSGAPPTGGAILCGAESQTPQGRLAVSLSAKKGGRVLRYQVYWQAGANTSPSRPIEQIPPVELEAMGAWDGTALHYRAIGVRVSYSLQNQPQVARRLATEGYRVVLMLSDGRIREQVVKPPKHPTPPEAYGQSAPHFFDVAKAPTDAIAGPASAWVLFADGSAAAGFRTAATTPLIPPALAKRVSTDPFAWDGKDAWSCGPRPWK